MKQTIHHRQQAIFTYIFLLLSSIAFLAACQRDNCKDEKRAYSLFLEAVNYNADGDKKQAILLIDSALDMNCADTTRSWLTSEKMTAYTDLGQMREAIEIERKASRLPRRLKITMACLPCVEQWASAIAESENWIPRSSIIRRVSRKPSRARMRNMKFISTIVSPCFSTNRRDSGKP